MQPVFVDIQETRRLTSLSRSTIYKLIAQQRLVSSKVGSRRLITVASIRSLGWPQQDEETDAESRCVEPLRGNSISDATREI